MPTVDDVQIEVFEYFKYLGSLKSADMKSRIGMAKKRMLDIVPIWRDRNKQRADNGTII